MPFFCDMEEQIGELLGVFSPSVSTYGVSPLHSQPHLLNVLTFPSLSLHKASMVGPVQPSWPVSLQPNSFSTLSAFRTCNYSNLFKYFYLFLFPEMMTFSLDYLFSFVL